MSLSELAVTKVGATRESVERDSIIPMVHELAVSAGGGTVPKGMIVPLADLGLGTFDITFGEDLSLEARNQELRNRVQNARVGWTNYGRKLGFSTYDTNRLTAERVIEDGQFVGLRYGLEAQPESEVK